MRQILKSFTTGRNLSRHFLSVDEWQVKTTSIFPRLALAALFSSSLNAISSTNYSRDYIYRASSKRFLQNAILFLLLFKIRS